MERVHYNFYKNGHKYSATGDNAFSAKLDAETRFHVDLDGAKYEQYFKMRVIDTGTV